MVEKSYKFRNIETYLLKLVELFMSNQNILKYIYYLDNDPLNKPDVKKNLLDENHITLTMFDEEILTKDRVKVFINPFSGNMKSYPASDLTFVVDIVIPNNYWVLFGSGKLRAFRIADELSQMIDGKFLFGMGDVVLTDFRSSKVNKYYSCLSLFINVKSNSMKGL